MRSFFVPINGIQWLTLVLVAVTAAGFIYGFARINDVQRHQNDALRSILCFAEHRVEVAPGFTPQQRRQAILFYEKALEDANLEPCK